ncbi:energy transducer TonB [Lutibacter sp. A80]|uniref:energy transducer TonB n=1 Tax=Lutibacter sp. A80 TaxID=2918453 RepID=UPI001F06EF64|nr:energy transducer TonB [Lutibacter sp. A80]UMB61833.1 energy transducer TonB [Lutibacter sp. A80]
MSSFLNTKHKRKSAVITSVIMSLLLILMFFVGMTYLDPPEEYGIAVNFGTSNVGQGNVQPKEPLAPAPKETVEEIEEVQEEIQEEVVEESTVEEVQEVTEDVATQESEESIAIKKQQEAKKKAEEIAKQAKLQKEKIEREKQAAIAKQKAEEAAKREKLDALIGGVSNSKGTATGGEGDDNEAGDKGKVTGDPNASGYYGNGGGGGDGDYNLGGRKPLSRPKPNYICNEEGLVVVSIEVDTNGRVIKATAGVKGSTNTATCLLTQAKEAALKTTWQADSNAPSKQVGTIKYRFSLSQ